MTLGIITDCTHYQNPGGGTCTENHILLRQFQQLSTHFNHTIIACPFGNFDPTKVVTSYSNTAISFIQLPLVGGTGIKDKTRLFATIPKWLKAFKEINRQAEVVYQRFPNNLNIPGFLYFWLKRKKVFATYTGTWSGYEGEPLTYKLQRWILKHAFNGPVWVYEDGTKINGRIQAGYSPSYSLAEWEEESDQVQDRIEQINKKGLPIYRFITVGTLVDYKNQITILRACKTLKDKNFPFTLTIVGDGPMKNEIEKFILENDLQLHVSVVGKKNHVALRQLYRENDFVVQAPLKEGFGKVPVEGFFHGLIPIINNVSMAANMTGNGERGFLFDANKPNDLVETLLSLPAKTDVFSNMIEKGRDFSREQTLESWAEEYYKTVSCFYNEA